MAKWDLVGEQRRPTERLGWGFGGYLEGVVLVLDNIEFKVGKGTKVSFWTDHWCGNEVLSKLFPSCLLWRPKGMPRRAVAYVEGFEDFSEEDSVIWNGGGHGRFRIRDAYKLLTGPLMSLPSRKRAFGWTRSQPKLLFLRGRLLGRRESQRDVSQLEGLFCGEKEEKDLDFHPVVYFLDGLEGEK
ncbi:hypothetical protein CK203_092255 [Vitis vinifera]|uniref:Reverse transcriptase zinc-binding domain-containing protein n=1 Tax=Vitis vinifera TaxID=29760 RepID=A0A438F8B0_VITVI|nr:hypothetical protein CK203_092255 [Vitis vinifera]